MSKLKMDAFDASLLVLNTMAGFLIVGDRGVRLVRSQLR